MVPKFVYRDQNVAVVDKPPLVLTVPPRFAHDERPVLGRLVEQELKARVWPVHRLDFEVSGLVVFALNAETHRSLNQLFESRDCEKTYQALTRNNSPGPLPAGAVRWQTRMLRGKKRSYPSPHGEVAITVATLLRKVDGDLLWSLQPVTGRPHQLRMELAKQGYPIVGDHLYSSDETLSKNGIALRSIRLELPATFAAARQMPRQFEVEPLEWAP